MKGKRKLSKGERLTIVGALLWTLVSLFLLFRDDLFSQLIFSNKAEIGAITYLENDARYRPHAQLVWHKADETQAVHVGDSVFAGEKSQAVVTLHKGGDVTVGENSLVVFSEIANEKMANLMGGNFLLNVNGAVKIAVDGELTTVEGKNSQVQVVIAKNKQVQMRLLKGEAKVKPKGESKKVDLTSQPTVVKPASVTREIAQVSPSPAPEPVAPSLHSEVRTIRHLWTLYDLYEQKGYELQERSHLPPTVSEDVRVWWSHAQTDKASELQHANSADLQNPQVLQVQGAAANLKQVYLGENYWRVRTGDSPWSLTEKFSVETAFLERAAPTVWVSVTTVPLVAEKVRVQVSLTTSIKAKGFVVQASEDPDFNRERSRIFWSAEPSFNLSFFRAGEFFYRFRAVDEQHKLSEWSETKKFQIFEPVKPSAPSLAHAQREGYVGEDFVLDWNSKSAKSEVEIVDSNGNPVASFKESKVTWKPTAPGYYQARAVGLNKYGQRGPASQTVSLKVNPKPVLAKKIPPPVERKPAQENQVVMKEPVTDTPTMNEKYKNSRVSVSGLVWQVQSSQQHQAQQAAPSATGAEIRGLHWWGSHGAEGAFKTGVFGLNETGRQMALQNVEGRYHYRFYTGFPFGWARELQWSGFLGYEMYRNSGGTTLSSQYDLVKFGTTLEFPWMSRWSSGGEFVFGEGASGSKKEISGQFRYYLTREWTMGCGYRIHLFEAKSLNSTPTGVLPYREGYTELYSAFDYHF